MPQDNDIKAKKLNLAKAIGNYAQGFYNQLVKHKCVRLSADKMPVKVMIKNTHGTKDDINPQSGISGIPCVFMNQLLPASVDPDDYDDIIASLQRQLEPMSLGFYYVHRFGGWFITNVVTDADEHWARLYSAASSYTNNIYDAYQSSAHRNDVSDHIKDKMDRAKRFADDNGGVTKWMFDVETTKLLNSGQLPQLKPPTDDTKE